MYIILITIILTIITIFYLNNDKYSHNINNNSKSYSSIDTIIETLLRQSSRWSLAAQQNGNPLIAVLHANYGAAYLWALKDITTSEEIKRVTGIDVIEFQKKITEVQDIATKKLAKLCPQYAGDSDKYLAAIAGENG